MSFFDRKQEVVHIELTDEGRRQLAEQGGVRPAYYSFFDDDVLYDERYSSLEEHQNSIESRIKESPRVKAEKEVGNLFLGNSELSSEYYPAVRINYLEGELGQVDLIQTGSGGTVQLPQLSSSIKYRVSTEQGEIPEDGIADETPLGHDFEGETDGLLAANFKSRTFPDGTFVEVRGDYLLLEVIEDNSLFENENFDIEVFEVAEEIMDGGLTKEVLIPMNFSNEDISVDEDDELVDFYVDIFCDEEIDERVLCEATNQGRHRGVFTKKVFDCPGQSSQLVDEQDIYGTPERGKTPEDLC